MRGGSLKISLSRSLIGKAGWYCVTKGRNFVRANLFLWCRAVFLSANFTSESYFLKIAAGESLSNRRF